MSEKGLRSLQYIIKNELIHNIDFIIIGRDKNVIKDYAEEIIALANIKKIPWFEQKGKYTIKTRYAIAISWRWLLNFECNSTQLIVLHDSLLPKYRGFTPLVNQLINNESFIGVTALFASKKYDRGNIIDQIKLKIVYPKKIEQVISIVANVYGKLVIRLLLIIEKNERIIGKPQIEKEATYSLWRDNKDYRIEWSKDASYIKRFIDAVGFPYFGASTLMDNKLIRIVDSNIIEDVVITNREYGKIIFIIDDKPVVVCKKGLLKINTAYYDDNKISIFPLKKFRTRFE